MSDWVTVAKADEIKFGEFRVADVDGVQIVVFKFDGEYYAIEDLCTHDGGKRTGGTIEGAESALHVGHVEATGGGHYSLKIISAQFASQSRVARHRMVYAILEPLMRHHIHALALVTQATGES